VLQIANEEKNAVVAKDQQLEARSEAQPEDRSKNSPKDQPEAFRADEGIMTGIMLDTARRYYTIDEIKKYIDALAYKNGAFLHLHLTDNENVGVECELLGQTAAMAHIQQDGSYLNPHTGQKFLSRAQIADIMSYARDRRVVLMPEIDLPAHVGGFFDLARTSRSAAYVASIAVHNDPSLGELNLANETSMRFAEELYAEYAALFAGDLLRMYSRYAERNRWQVEIVSANESELGGYKEVIARIVGLGAYSRLKFESGGHRVQRVPATESQGRIHTSACTVAVMPEADELEDIELNPADLRIDTFRASGAGGQHINKTDSAVRITHLPTGMVVECQDGRSQHANKAQAMKVLAARLNDAQKREAQAKEAAERKSLIGSGDRSERIRTYNYPQGRVTDHRINLTLHKLDFVMDGDLEEITSALIAEHQAELLAAMGD